MPTEVSEGKSTQTPPFPSQVPEEVPVPSPPAADAPAGAVGRCANCLAPLAGPFCSECGQHVADYHRSVWRFVADFFDNTFCWDSKILRTLEPLIKRPGWLTQEFMAGRRVRYIHPLRLFLFTSAVCLTLLQFNHGYAKARAHAHDDHPKPGVAVHVDTGGDDEDANDRKPAASPLPAASVSPPAAVAPASASPGASVSPPPGGNREHADSLGDILRDTAAAGLQETKGKNPKTDEDLGKRWEAFGDNVQKQADKAKSTDREATTNLQQKASWVALAMLPIFAWLMRFTYGQRGGFFFAYLVFSLHYHTFLLLFWTAYTWLMTLVQFTHLSWLGFPLLLGFLVPPWYLYLSLQRFYGESRARTAAKTFAIGGLHLLAIVIGVAIAGVGGSLTIR